MSSVQIQGTINTYQPQRGNDEGTVFFKGNSGRWTWHVEYGSGSSSTSEYAADPNGTHYYWSKVGKYKNHMSTTNAQIVYGTATCTKISSDEAVHQCKSLKPCTLDCEESFDNEYVFMCEGIVNHNENDELGTTPGYHRLVTIYPDYNSDSKQFALGYINNTIVHEASVTFNDAGPSSSCA